jgi:hypothetical protein
MMDVCKEKFCDIKDDILEIKEDNKWSRRFALTTMITVILGVFSFLGIWVFSNLTKSPVQITADAKLSERVGK